MHQRHQANDERQSIRTSFKISPDRQPGSWDGYIPLPRANHGGNYVGRKTTLQTPIHGFPTSIGGFLARGHKIHQKANPLNQDIGQCLWIPQSGPTHHWVKSQQAYTMMGRTTASSSLSQGSVSRPTLIESIHRMCHCQQGAIASPMNMFGYMDSPNLKSSASVSNHAKVVHI